MMTRTVQLELPEVLYARLEQAARATHSTFDQVLLRALELGSPPQWDDVPSEFQTDLAAMDRLSDDALWEIVQQRKAETEMDHYQELLDKNSNGLLSDSERETLVELRLEYDRAMLKRAHAAALLRWRGQPVPPDVQLSE